MKKLKFHSNLKERILSGEKTSTWRLFDDKNLTMGDELLFAVTETGEEFAIAQIVSVRETILGLLTKEDRAGHETYTSDSEMFKQYERYYNRPVDKNTIVKIVKFRILKRL